MKRKLKFMFLFLLLTSMSYGQLVKNGRTGQVSDLRDIVENYCAITGRNMVSNTTSTFKKIEQKWELFLTTDSEDKYYFVDSASRVIEFKSLVKACNYMYRYGWLLVAPIPAGAGTTCYFEKNDLLKAKK